MIQCLQSIAFIQTSWTYNNHIFTQHQTPPNPSLQCPDIDRTYNASRYNKNWHVMKIKFQESLFYDFESSVIVGLFFLACGYEFYDFTNFESVSSYVTLMSHRS